MSLKYYVINLDKDKQRLSEITSQFKRENIQFTRIPGILGKDLSQEEINTQIKDNICQKFCNRSTIGCAFSHLKAWKTFIDSNTYTLNNVSAVFLEDDAELVDNFKNKLNFYLKYLPNDYDLVYLGCFNKCDYKQEYPILSYLMSPFIEKRKYIKVNDYIYQPILPLGLHGYLLSYKGACKLYKLLNEKIYTHIDLQIVKDTSNLSDFKIYALKEKLVSQNGDPETSNIEVKSPILFNKLFGYIADKDNSKLSYNLSVSLYNIYGIHINSYLLLFFLLGILIKKVNYKLLLPFLSIFIITELIFNNKFILNSEVIVYCIIIITGFSIIK